MPSFSGGFAIGAIITAASASHGSFDKHDGRDIALVVVLGVLLGIPVLLGIIAALVALMRCCVDSCRARGERKRKAERQRAKQWPGFVQLNTNKNKRGSNKENKTGSTRDLEKGDVAVEEARNGKGGRWTRGVSGE